MLKIVQRYYVFAAQCSCIQTEFCQASSSLFTPPPVTKSASIHPSDKVFTSLKKSLKGRKFSSDEEVIEAAEVSFGKINVFFLGSRAVEKCQMKASLCFVTFLYLKYFSNTINHQKIIEFWNHFLLKIVRLNRIDLKLIVSAENICKPILYFRRIKYLRPPH